MAIGANHSCKHNKRMWDSLQVHKQDAPLLLPTCILKVEKRESNTSYVLKTDKPKRWAQITHYRCTHKATRDARCTKSGKSCQKKKLTQITGHLIEFYLQDGWHMTLNNFLGATSPSHHTAIVGHLSSFINTFNSRPQNAETTIRCSQWQQVTSLLFWLDSYLHRKGQKWLELQKRKHRIPRETPERVEQKIALTYIYNMGMKGGQLASYKTKVDTNLHSWGSFADQGSRRLKFLLVLWYVRTSRPTPNPIPTQTPRPIPTPTRTPALNHESSPSSPSIKSCLEYKLL